MLLWMLEQIELLTLLLMWMLEQVEVAKEEEMEANSYPAWKEGVVVDIVVVVGIWIVQ